MKRSFTVLAVAAMAIAIICGAAFADASAVKGQIEAYGLTADVSGSTVTISGEKLNTSEKLDLGDISGLTIDWKATLTYLPGTPEWIGKDGPMNRIIGSRGNGVFKMTGGKIEILPSASRAADHYVWIYHGIGGEKVSLLGGEIIGEHRHDNGFDIGLEDGAKGWVLEIDGAAIKLNGTINSGNVADFVKGEMSKVNGVVIWQDGADITTDVFGKLSWGEILMSGKDMDWSVTMRVDADAKLDLEGADMTGGKMKLKFIVDGLVDIRGMTGTIVDMTINAGGEAIIAKDSKVTLLGGTVKRVALAGSGVSAAAAGESGKLDVKGSLTILEGSKLTIEDLESLKKDPSATIDVKGKIDLPSGTSPEQMKKLATDLGITGSVFEMDGKTYDDNGEETTGGGSGSSGACTTGAAALVAIIGLGAMKHSKK